MPDPALFPRHEWLRDYRAALVELPYPSAGYPDILGAESLRRALADYLGRVRGAVATLAQIVVCAGFTQGLTLVCRALGCAGARRLAVEEPCHVWHRATIEAAGLEPVPILVDDRGIDPAALEGVRADALLVAPAHSYNWRLEYNHYRPHQSLNYMTPAEYARHRRTDTQPELS